MALDDQQDEATLPGIPFRDIVQQGICPASRQRDGSGHTQAVDSAPIKANASMESVVPKMPATSMDDHLKKVSEENRETTKNTGDRVPAQISAPEHELKRVEKHHRNLRDSPVRPAGAYHKKYACSAIKRIITPMIPMPVYR